METTVFPHTAQSPRQEHNKTIHMVPGYMKCASVVSTPSDLTRWFAPRPRPWQAERGAQLGVRARGGLGR